MARKKREVSETGIYHVLFRGINSLFLTNEDYETFLSLLVQKANGTKIISYSLLENRIHIIADAGSASIGKALKPIATSYARYCNRTRMQKGKLFYDRFKSETISSIEELADAVAFVNFIAEDNNCGKYSSLHNPLCALSDYGLTEMQAKNAKPERLFMEDYGAVKPLKPKKSRAKIVKNTETAKENPTEDKAEKNLSVWLL